MSNFQQMTSALKHFWAEQGCIIHQAYDLEVGAGTFNPATFLRCLGPEPYKTVYVEPSRRPQDGRYGDNPNRVQSFHQMQVILKPSPPKLQELYLKSLETIGLSLKEHDIRFVHDDWENPTIGAWGLGWEIWADGMEVTQFTYFQSVGGLPVHPVSGELTYGLERLAMFVQKVDSIFDIKWNDTLTFGDLYKRSEFEWSHYNFDEANIRLWLRHFDDFEAESQQLIAKNLPIPAYDFVMKASHAFNILDARGAISVTERTGYIGRIRALAKGVATAYVKSREELGFPLLPKAETKEEIIVPPKKKAFDPNKKHDFLLEIGSEELPASFVPKGMASLEHKFVALLQKHNLDHGSVQVFGTPMRLAILVHDLAEGSQSEKSERKGPPLKAVFDSSNVLTKAGIGFFHAIGKKPPTKEALEKGTVDGVTLKEIKGEAYLYATIEKQGRATHTVLAEECPKLILDIDFPKKMRWADHEIEYARPLKWLVALFGKEILPFSITDIQANELSAGHRTLSPGMFKIPSPADYCKVLRKHHILVDVAERKEAIETQLYAIEKKYSARILAKKRVLAEVLHLTEWPQTLIGTFDAAYLKAPREVLISEMVEHQRYFPLENESKELLNHFVITCNTTPSKLIAAGNQMALSPRLADGVFLYKEDLKTPLETLNEALKNTTFQKELGSVFDKVKRLVHNVGVLAPHFDSIDVEEAKRAALLSKADLASHLVGEFPELQGIAGKLYALHHGESQAIATAIDEHWMPRNEKAPLPETAVGMLVSFADKIDNFLSCFAIGLVPTSSSDPYGLRRQAIGMIKMHFERKLHLPFKEVFASCFDHFIENEKIELPLKESLKTKKELLIKAIEAFFVSRFRSLMLDYDFDKEEIEAVLTHGFDDIFATFKRLQALHALKKQPNLLASLLEIDMRATKILRSQKDHLISAQPNPSQFEKNEERSLFEAIETIKQSFTQTLLVTKSPKTHDYEKAFTLLGSLQTPLNTFFDAVKVLDDNTSLRQNRLLLLQEVTTLTASLADFSKLH